ncbi:beta-ketoacyl-ACP synthase II [Microbulbifer yueqingensis]|uniref:3-oxoacyl-[acyl-carrier-protein] synthase 2 n=1 Tax=Microbulbifer yueqingensis TaxID=658219 RepID=A0A1G8ZNQ0_9GAMM|nr:beta-ketoacyl-ACP synthase II [Microbulbifer yueqingensis]SDK15770.1 3-oxoacyl-[acyl-carrier-protein] synthase II [Microbulbifer yueqingensis]
MSRRRVVVTGMGMVSPLGNTVDETWSAVLAGTSGAAPIESFDVSAFSTRFAATVKDFDPTPYMPAKEARKMDVFLQFGMVAGIQAIEDSGLEVSEEDAPRMGACIGSGMGGIAAIEENTKLIAEKGPRRVSPFFVPGAIINMVAGNLSIKYGLKGPNLSTTTACTTGTHAIGLGLRTIQYGDADVMVCGGAEMVTTPVGLGGFCAARALSTRNDDPVAASRPWDRDRDGFVLGEGAGVLVLEEYERAKARGAKIYAELTGFGMSGDAHHMTSPPEDGAGAALSMRNALGDARLAPGNVQYINAHGTSTPLGDKAEIAAVRSVFGAEAGELAVSSTKSMTGHLLGAAGAIEAIFSVLALRDQVAPPTINLENVDESCGGINLVPAEPQKLTIDSVLSNSFGFGGTNGSLVFGRV